MVTTTDGELLTSKEAARRSGLSYEYLTRLAKQGAIHGVRVGRIWLISAQSLQAYLDQPRYPGRKVVGVA